MREAEFLYRANPTVKGMAESGELQKLLDNCANLDDAVEKGYVQVMDQLDRAIQQAEDQEQAIYKTMKNEFGLDRARMHDEMSGIEGVFSPMDVASENYILAKGAVEYQDRHHK